MVMHLCIHSDIHPSVPPSILSVYITYLFIRHYFKQYMYRHEFGPVIGFQDLTIYAEISVTLIEKNQRPKSAGEDWVQRVTHYNNESLKKKKKTHDYHLFILYKVTLLEVIIMMLSTM